MRTLPAVRLVPAAAGVDCCLPLPLLVLGEVSAAGATLDATADVGRCSAVAAGGFTAVPALAGRGVVALLFALLWLCSPTEFRDERLLLLAEGGLLDAVRALCGCWSCAAVPSAFKDAEEVLLLVAVVGAVETCGCLLEPVPVSTLFLPGLDLSPT